MQLFKDNLNDILVDKPIYLEELTLFPIHFKNTYTDGDLITFDEAYDRGLAEAFEVSESGIVERIGIQNKSDQSILILDGEAITGAKQNRISISTVIIQPHSKMVIPVNCVERGRWGYRGSRNFAKSDFSMSPKMRDRKARMMKDREHHRLQSEVWNEIDNLSHKLKTSSHTADLGEVLSKKYNTDYRTRNREALEKDCNGYLVFGTERPFVELFYDKQTCRKYTQKSIRSWMADSEGQVYKHADADSLIQKFQSSLWDQEEAVGSETVFSSKGFSNGRCVFSKEKFVHGYYYF